MLMVMCSSKGELSKSFYIMVSAIEKYETAFIMQLIGRFEKKYKRNNENVKESELRNNDTLPFYFPVVSETERFVNSVITDSHTACSSIIFTYISFYISCIGPPD